MYNQKLTRLRLRSVHLVAHLLGSRQVVVKAKLFVHLLSHSSSSTTHPKINPHVYYSLALSFQERKKNTPYYNCNLPPPLLLSPHHHTCYNIKTTKIYSRSAWELQELLFDCVWFQMDSLLLTYTIKEFFFGFVCFPLPPFLEKPMCTWMNDFYMLMFT
jgi:hypothetical protein